MVDSHPLVKYVEVTVPACGATTTTRTALCVVPWAATVEAVEYVPSAAITGADTNTRTISVKNKSTDGTGTTSIASLALVSGVSAAAHDQKALTLTGTAADLSVAAGAVLAFESVHAASGLADPGGLVRIKLARA